jgi:hypothetical protein
MIVYKVVREENGEYISAVNNNTDDTEMHIAQLKYQINKTSTARTDSLGIFCFHTLNTAQNFKESEASRSCQFRILKCETDAKPRHFRKIDMNCTHPWPKGADVCGTPREYTWVAPWETCMVASLTPISVIE